MIITFHHTSKFDIHDDPVRDSGIVPNTKDHEFALVRMMTE